MCIVQLGLLVNTLIADEEYSRSNRQNLPLPIQMQLSEKCRDLLRTQSKTYDGTFL